MAVKVAINGFGRIGRLAFRQMFDAEGYEVVAINDLTSPKMLAHLLKYDSTQGRYEYADSVEAGENSITVNGKEITIYAKPNPEELPWGELDVDVVLECTGFFASKAKAEAHIKAGAKKVIISAPAKGDLKTIVYNVNDDILTGEEEDIITYAYHVSSTIEKLQLGTPYDVCVIDEAQMIADNQRGWAWTRAIIGVLGFLWERNFVFGIIIGIAMILNMIVATITGYLVPVVLKKFKVDPALASSIFVTTFTDVLGFFFFLGLATLLIQYLL